MMLIHQHGIAEIRVPHPVLSAQILALLLLIEQDKDAVLTMMELHAVPTITLDLWLLLIAVLVEEVQHPL